MTFQVGQKVRAISSRYGLIKNSIYKIIKIEKESHWLQSNVHVAVAYADDIRSVTPMKVGRFIGA